MIEGLEIISRVVTRYGLVEILYMKGTSDAQKQLREQLIVLYAAVLRYLCKARRFYSHNTAGEMPVAHRLTPLDFYSTNGRLCSASSRVR
jgi:hypothetical protein